MKLYSSARYYSQQLCFVLIAFLLCTNNNSLYSQNKLKAPIDVDIAASGTIISPLIYGQFIEHLGRCIKGDL